MRSGFCDACEGQALALRLRRRAARATVVQGPSRLYQREASVYPTASVYPARGVLACGVIACRFSCIAYLAPAIAPSSWPS